MKHMISKISFDFIVKFTLLLLFIWLFYEAVFLLKGNNTTSGSVAAVFTILTLCFLYLSRFRRIKGLGFEAEMWEEKQEEAERTLVELRSISSLFAKVLLTDLISGHFMGGMGLDRRIYLYSEVRNRLKKIGINESEIADAEGEWRKGICVIYHGIISRRLQQQNLENPGIANLAISPEIVSTARELDKLLNFEEWKAPLPDIIEELINRHKLMNNEIQEWIEDYRHYIGTGEIRRQEKFVRS